VGKYVFNFTFLWRVGYVTVCYFIVTSLLGIQADVFLNYKFDSTNLTNLGFAVYVGIATLLFNWSRALINPRYQLLAEEINYQAIRTTMASFLFISASLIKYIILHSKMSYTVLPHLGVPIKPALQIVFVGIIICVNIITTELVYEMATLFRRYFKIRKILLSEVNN